MHRNLAWTASANLVAFLHFQPRWRVSCELLYFLEGKLHNLPNFCMSLPSVIILCPFINVGYVWACDYIIMSNLFQVALNFSVGTSLVLCDCCFYCSSWALTNFLLLRMLFDLVISDILHQENAMNSQIKCWRLHPDLQVEDVIRQPSTCNPCIIEPHEQGSGFSTKISLSLWR